MRIAVLSDIHGNTPAIDQFVVAGDLLGGPNPDQTIGIVKNLNAHVVQGNSERYLFDYLETPGEYEGLRWALVRTVNKRVSEASIRYLKGLSRTLTLKFGRHSALVVHSTPELTDEVFYPAKDGNRTRTILAGIEEDVLVCGHSHRQWFLRHGGKVGVNPGSVGFLIGGAVWEPTSQS